MADEELTPEREAQIKRLLADAKAEEPAPPTVVHRLDRVLEGLAAEGALQPADPDPAVVHLTARRRRRVAALLLGAAAVFVIGTGVNQVMGNSGGDDAATSAVQADDANGAAEVQEAPDRTSADDSSEDFAKSAPAIPEAPADGSDLLESEITTEVAPYAVRLGGGGLNRAAQRVRRASVGAPVGESGYVDLTDVRLGRGLTRVNDFACTPAAWGPGRLVPILYEGTPNVLALRSPEGDTQVVEVLQCGTGDVVRSLTLTVRTGD